MFTGIVEEMGRVVSLRRRADSAVLTVDAQLVLGDAKPGDSIAVNGCCLTVVERGDGSFSADVMQESLDRTALGRLSAGDKVNLERSVTPSTRLGGHLVQGHIDGTGVILRRARSPHWDTVTIAIPAPLARFVALKGAIAVDGVSLTISGLESPAAGTDAQPDFSVSLIPTTLERTTLGFKTVGELVNIEVDVLAKYVDRQLGWHNVGVDAASPDGRSTDDTSTAETQPFAVAADGAEGA